MSSTSDLSDDEFLAVNHRSIAKLRRKCPDLAEADLVRALRQAQGKHATSDRIMSAALKILGKSPPAG